MTRNSDPKSSRKLAYTYTEARELISMGQRTWMTLITSGLIKPIDGHNIVALAELERYLQDHTKERGHQKKATQKNEISKNDETS